MKRILIFVLITAIALGSVGGLTSCQGKESKLVCGVTVYEPMNYRDGSGNWTGFDTEFAQLVGEKLNMPVEFQEIQWAQKFTELQAGTINCIWNGFSGNTTESETGKKRSEYVDLSYGYMLNQQCVVVKAERTGEFKAIGDLTGKSAAAETGSAGDTVATEAVGDSGKFYGAKAQIDAFTEVKAGSVDCAVVDVLLARSMIGAGNYSDLTIANIELDAEIFAVGFKKGSELKNRVNKAMKELDDEGKLAELAKKYGLENSLFLDVNFKG
jgi:polar amino acid transport system substrate-binding protein